MLEQALLIEGANVQAGHRLPERLGCLRDRLGVVEARGRVNDRARSRGWILGLEDSRAHEDAFRSELHHERRVRGRCEAPGREVDHG